MVSIVLRPTQPLIAKEAVWRERYAVVAELMDHMKPLFVVCRNAASDQNRYVVAVPPDEELEPWIAYNDGTRRLPQGIVRAHILHGRSLTDLKSLSGTVARVELRETGDATRSAAGGEVPTLFEPVGKIVMNDANGNPTITCAIRSVEYLAAGNGTTSSSMMFAFLEKPLHTPQQSAHEKRSTHRSATAPLWQRVPCTALPLLASSAPPVTADKLLLRFKSDEDSVRDLLTAFGPEKAASMTSERLKRQVLGNVDRGMLHLETEVAMFARSYVCMEGYEDFIVAKVSQIVEGALETFVGVVDDTDRTFDFADAELAAPEMWTDDEQEQIAVGFHILVSASLAAKLLGHWKTAFVNEDFAFAHACATLRREKTLADLIPIPNAETMLDVAHFSRCTALVELLDRAAMSVFSVCRVMEAVISSTIDVLRNRGVSAEVTADLCIPLVVFVLVQAAPLTLPSQVQYVLDFNVPALEMSSLGYALTTFEAATAQVLEEYRLFVKARMEEH